MEFRALRAEEIECRVQQAKENGFSLLLYKDARCDMAILDETVGCLNWQREHSRDNKNCTVSIWDKDKGIWVRKEDTGTESNTEKEKGLASDSFKRACFNVGIGRELYTAPFIWVNNATYIKTHGGKFKVYEKFRVAKVDTVDGRIVRLVIIDSKGNDVFKFGRDGDKERAKKLSVGKQKFAEAFMKYEFDIVAMAFEEIEGIVTELEGKSGIDDLVSQIDSVEKITNIGEHVKKKAEDSSKRVSG